MARGFRARHAGPCAGDCGGRIQPGDLIEPHPDGHQHVECGDVDRGQMALLEGDRTDACSDCHMIHRGECL